MIDDLQIEELSELCELMDDVSLSESMYTPNSESDGPLKA
jgi:hypothetical protein